MSKNIRFTSKIRANSR